MPPSTDNKYALTSWGQAYPDLEMPSGQIAQVRRPGLKNLIKLGILDAADPLLSLVENKHIKRVKGQEVPELDLTTLLKNPDALAAVMESVDKVVMHVVMQPAILPVPHDDDGQEIPMSERTPGVGYIDMIGDEDKMFIYNYAVGGSADVADFRDQLGKHADDLATEPSVPVPTKRSPRARTSR